MSNMPSIPSAFRATAASLRDQPVLLFPDHQFSFAEIDRQSDRCAAGLGAQGVRKGDRVALYCVNGADFVTAYLGILKAGAIVVPINLLLHPREVAYILRDAGVSALIYHQDMASQVQALGTWVGLPGLLVAIGAPEPMTNHYEFDELLATAGPSPDVECDAEQDLAAIVYTSGTTGRPKGAMLTHANLVSNTRSVLAALALRPGNDRLVVVLPMFHSFAATVGMLTPLLHGLALAPLSKFDPALLCDTIDAVQATVFLGVPSMYNLLLRLPEERTAAWRSIRMGVSGGAAMPAELMRCFEERFGFPILEGDGPTECSPVTCVNPPGGVRKPASVGLPVPDVEIEILDDAGHPMPVGEIGELCVRGPNVMKGYWHLPEATAETFHGDWLRTGDLGYKDIDGYLFILDRKKDLIIVNGMNVYPRMVEDVLQAHADILEAAVVGEPHPSHGEIVVAHLVARPGSGLSEAEVKAYCRQNLGLHQRPREVVLHETLPRNATGKILKRELRRRHGEFERGVDSKRN